MGSELAPLRRLVGLSVAFALLYLASPGSVWAGGAWPCALAAMVLWARTASRPGRRAFLIDWVCGTAVWSAICWWNALVFWAILLAIGPTLGLFTAVQGAALRRFARRLPLAIGAPLAWLLFETVRAQFSPPFGFPWMRLGAHLHDASWINGSARVWGTGGLSFVLAALGGLGADVWNACAGLPGAASEPSDGTEPARWKWRAPGWPALAGGLAPLVLGVVFALAVPAPEMVDGPRILLVQPAIPQARKMAGNAPHLDFETSVKLTRDSLAEARKAGEPPPDLVAWGETMLRAYVIDPELPAAMQSGTRVDPWWGRFNLEYVLGYQEEEHEWVDGELFGVGRRGLVGVLPAGTAFTCGAEHLFPLDGRVRRKNAVFVWQGPGVPTGGPASKRHLVPGAETMLGLEQIGWVRDVIYAVAGYVPDLVSGADDAEALEFTARDGRKFRFGVSVCFDNAFDDPYTEPLRRGDLDFHAVFSNEAWFRDSQEADQMIAFSRLIAIATGRSLVRATNSGITTVIAPDGRELGRVRVGDKDREVPGTLRVTVPVPAGSRSALFEVWPPGEAAADSTTPFVRLEYGWIALWTLVPLAVLALLFKSGARPAP
jgi:apolipoprotein N-acyltransferase